MLILTDYSKDTHTISEAQAVAEAQIHLQEVRAYRTALMRKGEANKILGDEAGQRLPSGYLPEILVQLERLDRYEARALSRRKFAMRRFLALVNCT
jgi:hypothetical protein